MNPPSALPVNVAPRLATALIVACIAFAGGCREHGGALPNPVAYPSGHEAAVSRSWPTDASTSRLGWPPSHGTDISRTWPGDHDRTVSSTWWSGHAYDDSRRHIWPPLHASYVSEGWSHTIRISSATWPPNHGAAVSGGWGSSHAVGVSLAYPPGHDLNSSRTWTGPQATWPAGHAFQASRRWSSPVDHVEAFSAKDDAMIPPLPWYEFPAGHRWLDSYKQTRPTGSVRDPWIKP
jgi:hypothetical protein